MNQKKLSLLIYVLLPVCLYAQQVPDMSYNPKISSPMYAEGTGPIVFIDEGHHNFHTLDAGYRGFANLLERDGYQVKAYRDAFTAEGLRKGKVMVISNALHESNVKKWVLPTPSAFSQEEIERVRQWVEEGGSLFLIADHMPMGGAAQEMAAAFGFTFTNGFARKKINIGNDRFTRKDGTLHDNIMTQGRNEREQVDAVVSFTGQAFQIPEDATPILTFSDKYINLLPDTAWVFNKNTRRHDLEGWAQGAYKRYGKGRVVAFGEAAMFTAQLAGPKKIKFGMSHKSAGQNYKLLLNIIHWLDGTLY